MLGGQVSEFEIGNFRRLVIFFTSDAAIAKYVGTHELAAIRNLKEAWDER